MRASNGADRCGLVFGSWAGTLSVPRGPRDQGSCRMEAELPLKVKPFVLLVACNIYPGVIRLEMTDRRRPEPGRQDEPNRARNVGCFLRAS